MSKTPEQLAEDHAWSVIDHILRVEDAKLFEYAKQDFLAGYQAAIKQVTPTIGDSDQACHLYAMLMTELSRLRSRNNEATYWMPLPQPPTTVK